MRSRAGGAKSGQPAFWPAIRTTLSLSYAQLSYIDSLRVILQTFSGPIWGMLSDRYNRKWILVIGTGIWGLWTSLCGFATDYWQLLSLRVIACIGLGCLYPAAFSLMAHTFGPKNRGRAMGTISGIGMFGIVRGALIFEEVIAISDEGWRYGFIGLGLMSILSGIVIAILVKENPQPLVTSVELTGAGLEIPAVQKPQRHPLNEVTFVLLRRKIFFLELH